MRGLPDSVILGTIGHAKRRAVKHEIAGRRAGSKYQKYADLTPRDYVGGMILLLIVIIAGAVIL